MGWRHRQRVSVFLTDQALPTAAGIVNRLMVKQYSIEACILHMTSQRCLALWKFGIAGASLMSRKILIGVCLSVLGALAQSPAHASVLWNWTFSDPNYGNSAIGTLTTNNLLNGSYLITGITGAWNGSQITGLDQTGTCCTGGPSDNNDNLLLASTPLLDIYGFAFSVGGGPNENIYFDNSLGFDTMTYASIAGTYGAPSLPDGQFSATRVTTSVPEPSTLALFALGLVGFAMTRRRRMS